MATRKTPSKRTPIKSAAKTRAGPTPVDATKHTAARRTNIPTAELEPFARDEEKKTPTMLYPRDPSLDPQLVWKGKDEQDTKDLAVPVVPIYIQEKIAPRAIIEDLRAASQRATSEPQLDLFSDFNGLEFEQLIEFYQHSQHWSNRMILGDSLLVMTSLAEKEGLKGQVQMIYVDPPYGIRFGSNWQVSTRKARVADGRAEDTTRQPEQIRAFRDTWKLGIHSYLAYLRDRLVVARDLLRDSGSLCVQIGDENIHLVRSVLDEVFGSENFVALTTFKKTAGLGTESMPSVSDYIIWYAKDRETIKVRSLYRPKELEGDQAYTWVEDRSGQRRRMTAEERENHSALPPGSHVFREQILLAAGRTESCIYPVRIGARTYLPTAGRSWSTNEDGMKRLIAAGRVIETGSSLSYLRYAEDFPVNLLSNFWDDTASGSGMDKVYVVQSNTRIVERCLLMSTDPGDLVLDPTCGSGTTAYVAEQWGRRWITVDTSRVALALARTRLMSARYPYYILKDSPAGLAKEAEVSGVVPPSPLPPTSLDVRQGFVYERVPHVTLRSIANNPDIREGMSREDADAAIAKHAESETLFDRPYPDSKVVRVTGPFTVESLSPHRILPDEPGSSTPVAADAGSFVTMIIDNLRKAGVQNTVKQERLAFDRLEPWPGGMYVQAAGEYTEKGKSRNVAVAIGPEHGTVGREFIREAAKEAIRFADLLVVCGFAFEAYTEEESKPLGRLTIVKAKMNPDLSMGDELLKKTGAGNLFMVFGEPDVAISRGGDGQLTVEVRGVDVYDPTTGVVRSRSTDDIAAWFIDTNYDGTSFFVRHAYFLGADDPYEKLRRALRADIDEAAWASLYRTTSRPFPKPETGKIAVKVINHYGDEILKVYQPS